MSYRLGRTKTDEYQTRQIHILQGGGVNAIIEDLTETEFVLKHQFRQSPHGKGLRTCYSTFFPERELMAKSIGNSTGE